MSAERVLSFGFLALALSTAGATASPIRFDNPAGLGHFIWWDGPPGFGKGLNVQLPADGQPDTIGDSGQFHQDHPLNAPFSQVSGGTGLGLVEVGGPFELFLVGVNAGALIPSSAKWSGGGYIYSEGFETPLPEGQPTYLGIRFPLDGNTHYGWIGVVRQNTFELDAFAWGYETETDVPIAAGVPEPGSLLSLALGTILMLCRHSRS